MATKLVLGIFLLVAIFAVSTMAYECGEWHSRGSCCSRYNCHPYYRIDENNEYCEWNGFVCCRSDFCRDAVDAYEY